MACEDQPALEQERLASIFRRLGAEEPPCDELAMFLFLRGAWRRIVREDDPRWADGDLDLGGAPDPSPDGPCAGARAAMSRLLAAGADRSDLGAVVRAMQFKLLFDVCYLLSDPSSGWDDVDAGLRRELEGVGWSLFETDQAGRPIRSMNGLHELVLSMDPTGREMRPSRGAPG